MVKWLWYANAVVIFGAALVLIIGLSLLPTSQSEATTDVAGDAVVSGDDGAVLLAEAAQ